MLYTSLILAIISLLNVVVFSDDGTVTNLVARTEKPTSFNDYLEGSSGSYSDGSSMSADSGSTIVWFCAVYSPANVGYKHQIKVTGLDSNRIAMGDIKTFASYSYASASANGFSAGNWINDNSLEITAYLYDESETIVDSKTITIHFSIGNDNGKVTHLIARLDTPAPGAYDDYTSNGNNVYVNGDTIQIHSLSNFLYFCSVYSPAIEGEKHNIKVTGGIGGSQESPIVSFDSYSSGAYSCYGWTASFWGEDSSLEVTSYLYDSSDSIIDSMTITIHYSLVSDGSGSTQNGAVTDLIARLDTPAPGAYDDYTSNGNNVYVDGSTITIDSWNTVLYFCSVYSPAIDGESHNIKVTGDLSGSQESPKSTFDADYSSAYSCYGWTASYWSLDEALDVTSYLYDTSGSVIDSITIRIIFVVNIDGGDDDGSSGYCQEKPGKSKERCYNQMTQAKCERYNKCEWIA